MPSNRLIVQIQITIISQHDKKTENSWQKNCFAHKVESSEKIFPIILHDCAHQKSTEFCFAYVGKKLKEKCLLNGSNINKS